MPEKSVYIPLNSDFYNFYQEKFGGVLAENCVRFSFVIPSRDLCEPQLQILIESLQNHLEELKKQNNRT